MSSDPVVLVPAGAPRARVPFRLSAVARRAPFLCGVYLAAGVAAGLSAVGLSAVGPAAADVVYFGFSNQGPGLGWQGTWRRDLRRDPYRESNSGRWLAPAPNATAMLVRRLHGMGYHQIVFGRQIGRVVGVSAIDPAGRRVQLAVDTATGGIVEARIVGPAGRFGPDGAVATGTDPARMPERMPARMPGQRPGQMPENATGIGVAPGSVREFQIAPLPRPRPDRLAAIASPPVVTVSPRLAAPPPADPDAAKERAERDPLVVY